MAPSIEFSIFRSLCSDLKRPRVCISIVAISLCLWFGFLTLSSIVATNPQIHASTNPSTMVQISQESRRKYWATRSSVRSFARTAHSFACSGLLASLAPSAALTRSLARSLRSLPRSWESEFLMSQNDLILSHSAVVAEVAKAEAEVVKVVKAVVAELEAANRR